MMTKEAVFAAARAQLALDLGCPHGLPTLRANALVTWRDLPGRRKYSDDTPFLEVLVMDGRLVISADERLLPWCKQALLPRQAQWLLLPHNLRKIEAGLAPFGYEIGDARHFYLPQLPCRQTAPTCPVRWYERDALEVFRADPDRWSEALAFNPHAPDMLAVAALDGNGQPIALAGASRDGAHLWQIGIRVLPPHQGRGLGAHLTALLKDELLRRDTAPLYSTAESHIASQNTGLSAGFRPAFAYLYARPTAAQPGTNIDCE